MNRRWYIPVFILALAFFGIKMGQSTVPNQEIVVRFNTNSISTEEAQRAIANITSQLKALGVEDVQVSEILDGKLKVTYYSTIDVAVIKNFFYKQENLQLGDTAFDEKGDSSKIPFGNDSGTYKLNIEKIQTDYGSDIGLKGLLAEPKFVKDQYLNPIVSLGNSEIDFGPKHSIESVIFRNYRDIALRIDNTSCKIPEVRAGPLT